MLLLSSDSAANFITTAETLVSTISGLGLLLVVSPMVLAFLVELATYLGSVVVRSLPSDSIEHCSSVLREHVSVIVKSTTYQKVDTTSVFLKTLGSMTVPKFLHVTMNVSEEEAF